MGLKIHVTELKLPDLHFISKMVKWLIGGGIIKGNYEDFVAYVDK